MNKFQKSYALAGLVLASGIAISFVIVSYAAFAQTATQSPIGSGTTIQGITFPVRELGNCSNETDCRAYCNDPSHMQDCTTFASSHGLINKQDAEKAQKFMQALQSGGGPGGCTSPDQCAAYCSDITHLDACLAFAKANGINDDHVAQGQKISAYISSGGHMPGGCTSQESCQAYCGDFSHAEECYQFAKAAGISQKNGQTGSDGLNGTQGPPAPTPDQLRKLSDLAKNGQTPGGCKTKDDCQTYCSGSAHIDECLAFGVKAGFMTQAQADAIKSGGGNGPGGCHSPETCQAYCNDSAHQTECFKFAEDHGFINKNEATQIQNGSLQVRSGFDQMPPEVVACIKSSLDPATVTQIESGKLVPGSDVAGQIRSCFDKFGHVENPGQIFQNLPDTVRSCVKDKLGGDFDKIQSGSEAPTPAMADTIRVCFQGVQLQQMQGGQNQHGQYREPGQSNSGGFQDFLQTAPPDVLSCLQQTLGSDFDQFKSGSKQPDPSVSQKIQSCFNNFHPIAPPPSQGNPGSGLGYPTSTGGYNNPPPAPCPQGQYWNGSSCQAPPGGYQGSSTNFVPPPGYLGPPVPGPTCPPGQYWNGNSCVSMSSSTGAYNPPPPPGSSTQPQSCQQGQYWNGSTCVANNYPAPGSPPSSTAYTQCPSGQYWNGSSCVNSTAPASSSPPANPMCPSGQYWNGTTCMGSTTSNPATACSQSGGTWTGTTCQMPQLKPASSTSLSGFSQQMADVLNSMRLLIQTLASLLPQ